MSEAKRFNKEDVERRTADGFDRAALALQYARTALDALNEAAHTCRGIVADAAGLEVQRDAAKHLVATIERAQVAAMSARALLAVTGQGPGREARRG